MDAENLIGGAWLAAQTGVELVMPLAVQSRIGGRRSTHVADGVTTETYAAEGPWVQGGGESGVGGG